MTQNCINCVHAIKQKDVDGYYCKKHQMMLYFNCDDCEEFEETNEKYKEKQGDENGN